MTTGHAQDAEQPETGITPGDKGLSATCCPECMPDGASRRCIWWT